MSKFCHESERLVLLSQQKRGHTAQWRYILTVGLKEENRSLRVSNKSLLKENKSLSDKKSLSESSEPHMEQARPTLVPRGNLQPTIHALQADKERLEAEKKQLQEQLDELVSTNGSYTLCVYLCGFLNIFLSFCLVCLRILFRGRFLSSQWWLTLMIIATYGKHWRRETELWLVGHSQEAWIKLSW